MRWWRCVLAMLALIGLALGTHSAGGAPAEPEKPAAAPAKDKPKAKASPNEKSKDKVGPNEKSKANEKSKDKAGDKAASTNKAAGKDKAPAKGKAAAKQPQGAPKPKAAATAPTAGKPAEKASSAIGSAPVRPAGPPSPIAPPSSTAPGDVAALKEAIAAARKGRTAQAMELQTSIGDPVARKLVEWAILRSDESDSIDFNRYRAFIQENPGWPALGALRRHAEAVLWTDRLDPAIVRGFFANGARACPSSVSTSAASRVNPTCGEHPTTPKGRFALARALLLQGDRASAQRLVRETWRHDNFSADLEALALDVFGELITPADHKARMDMRLYAEDAEGAMRSATRLGGNAAAIARARIAVFQKAPNAKAMLDAVPGWEAHRDLGLIFSRVQLLRRQDQPAEAAQLILGLPNDPAQAIDADQWWIERRLIARKLIDLDDAGAAYRVASGAAVPSRENYRAEAQFTAGWIALRFLNDPATALAHFARLDQGTTNPITLARGGYWRGRTLDALGRGAEARAQYEAAGRHSTAYYGQLARARLGYKDLVLHPAPEHASDRHAAPGRHEVVRAIEILYDAGERDLVAGALADLGERSTDATTLAALGEVAARHRDARAMLLLGKSALGRGLPLEHYAFPVTGIPDYRAVGPAIEPAVVYAIARQESIFNPKTVSSARAMGLMQVTPEAGRYVARKLGVSFDERRLLNDQVYNVQLGAAELGDLYADYRGSHILTFAGYNAGRGRVREWVARHGDPRDPKVDPIDWVEMIPFSETRNYVQRVMENLQVYRVRFGGGSRLLIEADLRRGASAN
jgi:soluble lytic murein transglycosylase